MNLVVFICFARSGGTLLNRCLGTLDKTLIFSEISPLAYYANVNDKRRTIYSQAKEWYGINLSSRNLIENIYEIEKKYPKYNIIIRDWTFSNYFKIYDNVSPSNNIHIIDMLKEHFSIGTFAFVRNPIDIYLSLSVKMLYELEYFSKMYLTYTEEIIKRNIPYFKYEEFIEEPEKTYEDICSILDIKYNENFFRFNNFHTVLGDKQFYYFSRGKGKQGIIQLKRKRINKSLISSLENNLQLRKSNRIFRYSHSYYDRPIENLSTFYLETIKRYIYTIYKKYHEYND